MAGLPLPGVQPRYANLANQYMSGATGAYTQLTKDTAPEDPGPTTGGAVTAAASGAAAGASVGSLFPGYGTAIGAGVGAVFGMASYLLG
jgi:hypothetical protein